MSDTVRFLSSVAVDGDADAGNARSISWIFSNEDVCLDQHTIRTAGWDLDDFKKNPTLLFAHDQSQPPVGRVTRIEKRGSLLVGDTEFADAETYPFADTIFRLVKGRFLNATSVSWLPLEYRQAKDRSRPDGIDFLRQKLLEISVVPVPANPAALATARALGIDTGPLRQWAERVLDIGAAPAGARHMIEQVHKDSSGKTAHAVRTVGPKWKCGASQNLAFSAGDIAPLRTATREDRHLARKAFLAYDETRGASREGYLFQFAGLRNGRLFACHKALREASAGLEKSDLPDDVKERARAVVKLYEGKMAVKQRKFELVNKRGLYEVSQLAYLMMQANWLKQSIDEEEAREGDDDSANPANMHAVLLWLGKTLIDMTSEEVGEMLTTYGPYEDPDDEGEEAEEAAERAIAGVMTRAGRKMSKDDAASLRGIHEHCMRSARLLRTHIDQYEPSEDDQDEDDRAEFENLEAVHDHCEASADKLGAYIQKRAAPAADDEGADKKPASDPSEDSVSAQTKSDGDDEISRRRQVALRARIAALKHIG